MAANVGTPTTWFCTVVSMVLVQRDNPCFFLVICASGAGRSKVGADVFCPFFFVDFLTLETTVPLLHHHHR